MKHIRRCGYWGQVGIGAGRVNCLGAQGGLPGGGDAGSMGPQVTQGGLPEEGFLKDVIDLFLKREEGREKERETNINQLPLIHTQPGTKPAAQACALARNRTSDLLLCETMTNQLRAGGGFFKQALNR